MFRSKMTRVKKQALSHIIAPEQERWQRVQELRSKITRERFRKGPSTHPQGKFRRIVTRFAHWRRQRPFWGALLLIIAGMLVLWSPVNLFSYMLFSPKAVWGGMLVGTLLLLMGVLQLLAPAQAVITGSIGIVMALFSVMVALGGMGIGVLLGISGGALGVAWRPSTVPRRSWGFKERAWAQLRTRTRLWLRTLVPDQLRRRTSKLPVLQDRAIQSNSGKADEGLAASNNSGGVQAAQHRPVAGWTSRPVFWSTFAASLMLLLGMLSMISKGALAIAITSTVPLTATFSTLTINHLAASTVIIDGIPFLVARMDIEMQDLDLALTLNFPGLGVVKLHIKANRAMMNNLAAKTIIGMKKVTTFTQPFILTDTMLLEGVSLSLGT